MFVYVCVRNVLRLSRKTLFAVCESACVSVVSVSEHSVLCRMFCDRRQGVRSCRRLKCPLFLGIVLHISRLPKHNASGIIHVAVSTR